MSPQAPPPPDGRRSTPGRTDGVESRRIPVADSFLHYLQVGSGDPVLFLHGNPTSSVLWRQIIGPVAAGGRTALALDLIGMGRSGTPELEYRLADHVRYVDGFIEALGLRELTIVGHDWGAVIALHHARRFPGRVRAVAVLEGHLHPIERWADLDDGGRAMFQQLRTPGAGERMVLEENFFIETVLPAGTLRTLTQAELDAYREPFLQPSSRAPMLRWPREIPIEGRPADVRDLILANQELIADPRMPVLLIHGTPGAVVTSTEVAWARAHGAALTVADVGPGLHFLPEDCAPRIVTALRRWLDELA